MMTQLAKELKLLDLLAIDLSIIARSIRNSFRAGDQIFDTQSAMDLESLISKLALATL